jgi:hypothetical protein
VSFLITFFAGIGEHTETHIDIDLNRSIDSFSPNEHQSNKKRSLETKMGEASSSGIIIKRPRGRPPKLPKTDGWVTKKARTRREVIQAGRGEAWMAGHEAGAQTLEITGFRAN